MGEAINNRCDRCRFWVVGTEDHQHVDDRPGYCHRRSPVPINVGFQYEILKHLTMISWTHCPEEERDEAFPRWEEAHMIPIAWPLTTGCDWCGEFEAKAE